MVILDASVINKLFFPHEEGYDKVKNIIGRHLASREQIVVPDLLFYEVTNALATKTSVPKSKIIKALGQLINYNLEVFSPSIDEIIQAGIFAKDNYVSVYDAIYAILAREKKCDLITADEKFAKQLNLPFIKTLENY